MTILFDATAPVKSARRFGAGILASYPTHRVDFTASDAAWWAAETAKSEDAHYDRLAAASLDMDRLESGCC